MSKFAKLWEYARPLKDKKAIWNALNHAHHPVRCHWKSDLFALEGVLEDIVHEVPKTRVISRQETEREMEAEVAETSTVNVTYHTIFPTSVVRTGLREVGPPAKYYLQQFDAPGEPSDVYDLITLAKQRFNGVSGQLHIAKRRKSFPLVPDYGPTILSIDKKIPLEGYAGKTVGDALADDELHTAIRDAVRSVRLTARDMNTYATPPRSDFKKYLNVHIE